MDDLIRLYRLAADTTSTEVCAAAVAKIEKDYTPALYPSLKDGEVIKYVMAHPLAQWAVSHMPVASLGQNKSNSAGNG